MYEELDAPVTEYRNAIYVPVQALEKGLGCQYTWDIATNSANIVNVRFSGQKSFQLLMITAM